MSRTKAARDVDFLLVGGGLASASAAEALRIEGAKGSILMVGAEDRLPYHRPPLSKRILVSDAPREPPLVLKEADYLDRGIEVLRGTRAIGLVPRDRVLHTDHAGALRYGKLLIATGASPLHLQVPGAHLPGVHYLRSIDDALAIHAAARKGCRAVVIGASFIGMEVSASLKQKDLHVTLVAPRGDVFATLQSSTISRFFCSLQAKRGIEVLAADVTALEGKGRVEAVLTSDGRRLRCDLVVAGIGVTPDIDFLAESGIRTDNGVVVDDRLQSSDPDVFAAGDVAAFFDPVFRVRRRVEHWDNAVKQGRLAARNMLGQGLRYDEVSAFFCDVFDISFQFLGMPDGARERIRLGSPDTQAWAEMYLQGQVPRALFTSGRPAQETHAIQALIRYRTHIGRYRSRLADPTFSLTRIPHQTALILQGGGAMGAFECGVVGALEQNEIHADIVAGVSIGAFNGAIIASHPHHAAEALEAFWHELAMMTPALPDERTRRLVSSALALSWGVPGFLRPRWVLPGNGFLDAASWTSFYDTAPARALLGRYVDFPALRASPVRLLVSAVDVETAELRIFDSYIDELTADHIVASGSLPPGLPWATIGGRHYWDGGIISNSPLDQVVERCGATGKRIFIVDLFSSVRPLPQNMMDVFMRRDEIAYAERVRRTSTEQAIMSDFRKLVEEILDQLEPGMAAQIRQRPRYMELIGTQEQPNITRIVREGAPDEPASRDFDFSLASIRAHILAGRTQAVRALEASQPPLRGKSSNRR
jgi:NTE family protein